MSHGLPSLVDRRAHRIHKEQRQVQKKSINAGSGKRLRTERGGNCRTEEASSAKRHTVFKQKERKAPRDLAVRGPEVEDQNKQNSWNLQETSEPHKKKEIQGEVGPPDAQGKTAKRAVKRRCGHEPPLTGPKKCRRENRVGKEDVRDGSDSNGIAATAVTTCSCARSKTINALVEADEVTEHEKGGKRRSNSHESKKTYSRKH